MKNLLIKSIGIAILGLFVAVNAFAQQEGDYRSAAEGDWSAAATWEVYQGGSWTAAATAPTGSETITVTGEDTVSVDVAVSVTGQLVSAETGVVMVSDGSLEIASGGVYEHNRDAGQIPTATWNAGSTIRITGVTEEAPENSNQSYHHIVFNSPGLISNEHMSLDEVTISGDVRVEDTGSARWYLTSADPEDTSSVTIEGDLYVEGGQFAVQGTSGALTVFDVHHYGDIIVTGGNFSIARGSQGSGSGTTTWYLYGGDFSLSDAAMQNSNPTAGNASLVFAGAGTQQMAVTNIDYAGGDIHFHVSDSTTLEITTDFTANGQIVNEGVIDAQGSLTFTDGGIYVHARDAGTVPTATWEEGSTAMFTGITSDAPEDRGQDYFNLTLDTPNMLSNNDLSLDGNTISGDLTVISSGESRWRLVGGDSGELTIMGDVVIDTASVETQGTSSLTDVVVHHYGDVIVNGGNLSVSRGSQGSGMGTTLWYLYEGDFSMTDGESRNSNPTDGNARFIFASGGTQVLTLDGDTEVEDLSIEVADSTTLDLGTSEIGGDGIFWLQDGATVATAHADGIGGNLQTEGEIVLGQMASFVFNGTEAQVTSEMMPTTVHDLVIDNEAGVTLSQATTITGTLRLVNGVFDNTIPFTLSAGATLVVEGGSLLIPVAAESTVDLPTEFQLYANYPNPFNPSTVIRYDIKEQADVTVTVYDAAGRLVKQLVSKNHAPGRYEVEWNAAGQASGVYFYQIRAANWSATRSLLLVK